MAKSKGRLLSELSESPKNEDYSDINALPVTGNKVGDQGFVEGSNRLYIWNGSGWYNIALINTTPTWDSNGQPGSSYELSADSPQTATSITLAASDPEGIPIQYSYVTSGQMDSIATISQDSSVFTITPKTSSQAPDGGTGSITFRASDGINILPAVSSFTLNFVTTIDDSKYTVLLATATGTSDNNNITDSSSSSHSITAYGAAHAGTFSPYRSGGYSYEFDGTGTNYKSTLSQAIGNDLFTVEFWYNGGLRPSGNTGGDYIWWLKYEDAGNGNGAMRIRVYDDEIRLQYEHSTGYPGNVRALVDTTANVWKHYAFVVTGKTAGSQIKIYVDGVESSSVVGTDYALGLNVSHVEHRIGASNSGSAPIYGYLRDFRISNIVRYTADFTPPTETLTADSDTLWLGLNKPYLVAEGGQSITVHNGENAASPSSPYNYNEYDAAFYGGSMLFEAGDYLSIADHNDFNLTSDFTIKFWAWVNVPYTWSGNVTYGLFDNYTYNNGGLRLCINGAGLQNGKLVLYWGSGWDAVGVEQFNFIPEKDQWYYYELTRSGNTLTVKVNGESVGTVNVTNLANPTTSLIIGTNTGTGGGSGSGTYNIHNYLYGYMSDFQYITGGTASESSIPIAPMSTDTNSKLHIKGTDASIIDKAQGANLELVGNTTGSTTQAKFANTKSMYFDGTGDYLETSAFSEAPVFGTGNWTVEGWFYATDLSNFRTIINQDASWELTLYGSKLRVVVDTDGSWNRDYVNLYAMSDTLSLNTWYHFALVKNGNSVKGYTDGTEYYSNASFTSSPYSTPSKKVRIGRGQDSPYYWQGYLQDIRITKGLARYTANFTPPTAPLEG